MRGLRLTRVRGGPGSAVCGPRTEARPLGVIRRHFLLKGCDHGVGGFRTVELLVRHPVQLLGREVHVLMEVLVLLGGRQAEVLHQQLQRLQLVGPPGRNPGLLRQWDKKTARRRQRTPNARRWRGGRPGRYVLTSGTARATVQSVGAYVSATARGIGV